MRLEDLIGRRLGRYEIIDVLGRGGMAAVYRARDTVLRRDVALKILYPQYTGDTALVERFQRQVRRWSGPALAAGIDRLLDAELACKQTGAPDEALMRRACLEIARLASTATARR